MNCEYCKTPINFDVLPDGEELNCPNCNAELHCPGCGDHLSVLTEPDGVYCEYCGTNVG